MKTVTSLLILIVILSGALIFVEPQQAESAEKVPQWEKAEWKLLWNEVFPGEENIARAPFIPVRNDVFWKDQIADHVKDGKELTLVEMRSWAFSRQKKLLEKWHDLKDALPNDAQKAILAYAFKEKSLEDCQESLVKKSAHWRFKLAQLLMSECRFEEALDETLDLLELWNISVNQRQKANDFLKKYFIDYYKLEDYVNVVPMNERLEQYINNSDDFDGIEIVIEEEFYLEAEPQEEEFIFDENGVVTVCRYTHPVRQIAPETLHEFSINHDGLGFELLPLNKETLKGNKAEYELKTRFHGNIEFALYRVDSYEAWQQIQNKDILKHKAVSTWTQKVGELSDNNQPEISSAKIELGELDNAFFVLTARTLYCHVLAMAPFYISDQQLSLSHYSSETLLLVRNKLDGKVLKDQEICVELLARPDEFATLNELAKRAYSGGEVSKQEKKSADYISGQDLLKNKAPFKKTSVVKTDAQGQVVLKLNVPSTYRAEAFVYSKDNPVNFLHVQNAQQHKVNISRSQVWSDRSLYKPGEKVFFQGVYREYDNNGQFILGVKMLAKKITLDVFDEQSEKIFTEEFELTGTGSFSGLLELKKTSEYGAYTYSIDGSYTKHLFKVRDYKLPKTELQLNVPSSVKAQQNISLEGTLKYLNATPCAFRKVTLFLLEGKEQEQQISLTTDKQGRVAFDVDWKLFPQDGIRYSLRLVYAAVDEVVEDTAYIRINEPFTIAIEEKKSAGKYHFSAKVNKLAASCTDPQFTWLVYNDGVLLKEIVGESEIKVPLQGFTRLVLNAKTLRYKTDVAFRPEPDDIILDVKTAKESTEAAAAIAKGLPEESEESQKALKPKELEVSMTHSYARQTRGFMNVELEITHSDTELAFYIELGNTQRRFHKSLTLANGKHSISLPVDSKWGPNVYLTMQARRRGEVVYKVKRNIEMSRFQEKMNVSVHMDESAYEPGAECDVEIICVDFQGQPVANAEISRWPMPRSA